jgi:hypothetical protein
MARLGELLVAAGLLTADQIGQALRAQVMWGGRLGTNLIELGYLDLDALSRALGRQHHLPAALARHFERVDRELQQLLSIDIAERFSVVPLARVGPERKVVIASVAPLEKKPLAMIADELAIEPAHLIPSIAAELRIRYQLERIYKIPRSARFMRSPGNRVTPFPQFEILPITAEDPDSQVDIRLPIDTAEMVAFQVPSAAPASVLETDVTIPLKSALAPAAPLHLPEDDDLGLAAPGISLELEATTLPVTIDRAPTQASGPPADMIEDLDDLSAHVTADEDELAVPAVVEEETPSGRERRKYVRTIADAPSSDSERQALGRITIRRVAVTTGHGAGKTLGEATRAIRRGTDRDRVAELVMDTIFRFAPSCEAALMLVIRGEVAISWKGFVRSGATPPEIAVPMEQAGLVPRAVANNATVRQVAADLAPIDQLLLVSLGQQTGDLVVVPVSIANQVMCVIAMVTERNAQTASAESIAVAAGAAFARLMRDAGR